MGDWDTYQSTLEKIMKEYHDKFQKIPDWPF